MRTLARLLLMLALVTCGSVARADITIVGATKLDGISSGQDSLTLSLPTGVQSGDVLLAQVSVHAGASLTISKPGGWSLLDRRHYASDAGEAIYYRIADGSEAASYTWSFSSSVRAVGSLLAYRGVDTSVTIETWASVAGWDTTLVYAPSVTTSVDSSAIVAFFTSANGNNDFYPYFTSSARISGMSGAGPNGIAFGVGDGLLTSAGATGDLYALMYSADAPWVAHTLAMPPAASYTLDHIAIQHPGSAVTCEPASITLKACADAACTTAYPDPVTVTLSPSGGWSSNPVTFTGTTTVTLSRSTAQTVTLGATSSPAADNSVVCTSSTGSGCALSFADTGFVFSTIPSQTAGTSSGTITLRAVTTSDDGTACVGALAGTQTVQMASECVNPSTCAGRQVSIDGTAIADNPGAAVASYTPVTLDFGSNATASFTLAYPDVGQLRLWASHTADTGAVLVGSSNGFVVRPAGFTIGSIAAGATANPAATSATGPIFIGAGQPFGATVTAVTSTGAATPNFGHESPAEGVALTPSLELPVGGNVPALANDTIAGSAFANGSATVANLAWSEVGIIRLTAAADGSDYLGTGPVTGSASEPVGRFIPDHFAVTVTPGCVASGSTYDSQPFTVGVVAQAADNATTQNYAGDFARTTTLSNGGDTTGLTGNTIAPADYVAGSVPAGVELSYADPTGPHALRMLTIRALDSDGVSSEGHTEGSTEMRSGRLRLVNAVGSGLEPLAMPVQLETWQETSSGSGAYDWLPDSSDQCTVLTDSDFTVVGSVATLVTPVNLPNASGSLMLQPTGAVGTVDVTAELGGLAPWLQFDWRGAGVENPSARAGFGLNPGNAAQIYSREVIEGN